MTLQAIKLRLLAAARHLANDEQPPNALKLAEAAYNHALLDYGRMVPRTAELAGPIDMADYRTVAKAQDYGDCTALN